MNLDQVTIEIRPRRAWEAVDLGLLMARQWWPPLIKVWLALTLPLFLVLNLLPQDWLWLSGFIIWWLKPIFERPLLHMLSQAVFNEMPDIRSTLRAFSGLALRQIISSLTWRRLSPTRSMDLPVIQLEGLKGQRRKERLAVLHREESGPATWLTIMGAHIEGFLSLGILLVIFAFIPREIDVDWRNILRDAELVWFAHLSNLVGYIAMCLVAPFYVACGFSLYLNRRIKLEAWDIDIAFQRIVNKRRNVAHTLTSIVIVLGFSVFFVGSPDSLADTNTLAADNELVEEQTLGSEPETTDVNQSVELSRTNTLTIIEAILAGDDFHQKKVISYPDFFDNAEETPEESDEDLLKKLRQLIKALGFLAGAASLFEILMWILVLTLIGFVIYRYRYWLAAYLPQRVPEISARVRPNVLFGMDVSQESLPKDVSAKALQLWRSGEQRAALALLYRACLVRLLDAGLVIEDGHTEAECLELAEMYAVTQPKAQTAIHYFADLTGCWRRLAYGHIDPDPVQGEALCNQWNSLWRPGRGDMEVVND